MAMAIVVVLFVISCIFFLAFKGITAYKKSKQEKLEAKFQKTMASHTVAPG